MNDLICQLANLSTELLQFEMESGEKEFNDSMHMLAHVDNFIVYMQPENIYKFVLLFKL